MSKQSNLTAWSKSKPPMIGEYNASCCRDSNVRRWWDGAKWSKSYRHNGKEVEQRRNRRTLAPSWAQKDIEWRGLAEKPENFVEPQPLGPL